MESVRGDPNLLRLFLREMPKGGDLHNHLGGSVYAESFVKWAAEDGLCLVRTTLTLKAPPCSSRRNEIRASEIPLDAALNGAVIDAWSMRNWNAARVNGHDQFFGTFQKFGAATRGRTGDMLAEVTDRAASQNVSYMELMHSPDNGAVIALAMPLRFESDLGKMRERLLARGLRGVLETARTNLDRDEARQKKVMRCHLVPQPPGCEVTVRYLYQVLRGLPKQAVFAQILAGFELAGMDRRMVGFNLVMPEDDPVPMDDFYLHMRMIDYLHSVYPDVKITLHAGELAPQLVPPDGRSFHITESIQQGHAQRIGHGTAVLDEKMPLALLRQMADRKILVEISLSSSDVILGVRGKHHPLSTYLGAGVPVALATDDEGVLRSDLTTEYRRAVEEQGLDYTSIKEMARNSILYAFVDEMTKARLMSQLDKAFNRFEEGYVAGKKTK